MLVTRSVWVVMVDWLLQVRQHTEHKRTFMFLEQVILKYGAAANCINIKDIHEVSIRVLASLTLLADCLLAYTSKGGQSLWAATIAALGSLHL